MFTNKTALESRVKKIGPKHLSQPEILSNFPIKNQLLRAIITRDF